MRICFKVRPHGGLFRSGRITVHLTFAERAFELARWYRERGAIVVLGGLHVISCPEECAPHADALAIGEGVQVWGEILRDISCRKTAIALPWAVIACLPRNGSPNRSVLPRKQFLTTDESDCDARLSQSLWILFYLSTKDCTCRISAKIRIRLPTSSWLMVSRMLSLLTTTLVHVLITCGICVETLRPLEKIWSAGRLDRCTDDPSVIREDGARRFVLVYSSALESLNPTISRTPER